MARSDLEILAEVKLSNTREFNAQLRGLEKRKIIIDTKRSEQALGRITGKSNEFTKSLEASNARVIAFGASVAVIEGVRRAFTQLATTVVQVESSLTSINSIFGRSSETISKFGDQLFSIAKNTGQGFDIVAKSAQEFARQGLSVEETLKRTNDALILTRLTTLSTEKAISGLTAVVNGFATSALTTTDVINKLRAVETQFAVSSTDLIDAVSRSASVAQDAGISFEELLGYITAIKQRTGLGGATIGQGLKTALTRLNLPTRIQELKNLGVAVDESASTFDNLVTASVAIDEAQKKGERSLATQIGTVVAGQFQISKLSALFRDLASSQSIAGGATDAAMKATNQAILANEAYNKTIESISNQISQNIGGIFKGLGEAGLQDFFKSILTDINVFLEAIQGKDIGGGSFLANITKDIVLLANDFKLLAPLAEGFVNVLTGPAFVTGLAIVANTLKNVFTQGGASLLQLSGINKISEKRIANQRVIQSLLAQATASELQQLQLATTQAQKEQIILGLLTKQLATQKALEASSIRTAQSLSRQGVSLGGSVFTGDVTKSGRTKSFAGGTLGGAMQNEQRAINNGVGGASANAKVRVVDSFNYGKGRVGPAVLNTDEILIQNKNGDSVLNRDMVGSSAISSMGGNFAKGKIPMGKGMTYKASMEGFSKLLMGNTKFQSVKYWSKSSDSVRQLTGVQHSSMVAQSSKSGKPPPAGYSSWQQYQRENQMVTLRGMQGGEQVTRNIKLSDIRQVNAGGANYIPNFADGKVNIGNKEIADMKKRLGRGESLTNLQVSRVISGLKSGQGAKIPFIIKDAAQKQDSFAAQKAARGSGRNTPKAPPNVSEKTRVFPTQKAYVRDSKGRFVGSGGASDVSSTGPTGFDTNNYQPPALIQPSLADQIIPAAPKPKATDFSGPLEERQYKQFKKDFSSGAIPSGSTGNGEAFKKFKTRLQFELIEAELKKEAKQQGKSSLSLADLGRSKEGKKLRQSIVKAGLVNFRQIENTTAKAVQEALLLDAQTQLEKSGRGKFGFDSGIDKTKKSILQSPTGRRLNTESRAKFEESIQSRKIARSQRIQGAGFGLSFAGALAAPLIGQGVESIGNSRLFEGKGTEEEQKKRSQKAGNIVSGVIGGASTGASIGAFTGTPMGLAVGAGAGAILGGLSAVMTTVDDEGDKYSKQLEKQKEFFALNTSAMQTYVTAQYKLNDALESGTASGKQIANLFTDLQRTFNTLQSSEEFDPKIRQEFINASPTRKKEILQETQDLGAKQVRLSETQSAFSNISQRASTRRATIAEKKGSNRNPGYAFGNNISRVTNREELNLSKFTKEDVSAVIGGLLQDIDLSKINLDALKGDGDRISKLLAIGIPKSIAEALNIQFDEDSILGSLVDRELSGKDIGKKIVEQVISNTIEQMDFKVKTSTADVGAAQRSLFQANAAEAAGARQNSRGVSDRSSQFKSNNLQFLSGQGFDQSKKQENLKVQDIKRGFEEASQDLALSLSSSVDSLFKDKIETFSPEKRAEIAPILDRVATSGVTFEDLGKLKSGTDDRDLQQDLINLEVQLAANRDALVNNTNQELQSFAAFNRQAEQQKLFIAALNDLNAGIGKTLPELFGTDKAQTSLTAEITKGMRDSSLKGGKYSGFRGTDPVEQALNDTKSPEAIALKEAANVLREQFNLITRSKQEGGQLNQDQSDKARRIFDEELSRGGKEPRDLADIPARIEKAFDRLADQGVRLDLDELVKITTNQGTEIGGFEAIREGLNSTVTSLKEASPLLSSVLSNVREPSSRFDGQVSDKVGAGNDSSKIADVIAGFVASLQAQEEAAKINRAAIGKLVERLNSGIIDLSQFTEAAGNLTTTLAEGIVVTNKSISDITINPPKGTTTRLDSIEAAVNVIKSALEAIVDSNFND
jgi:TP901 family phage tail tape measure protein